MSKRQKTGAMLSHLLFCPYIEYYTDSHLLSLTSFIFFLLNLQEGPQWSFSNLLQFRSWALQTLQMIFPHGDCDHGQLN